MGMLDWFKNIGKGDKAAPEQVSAAAAASSDEKGAEFAVLKSRHTQFHRCAVDVLQVAGRGDSWIALHMLEGGVPGGLRAGCGGHRQAVRETEAGGLSKAAARHPGPAVAGSARFNADTRLPCRECRAGRVPSAPAAAVAPLPMTIRRDR